MNVKNGGISGLNNSYDYQYQMGLGTNDCCLKIKGRTSDLYSARQAFQALYQHETLLFIELMGRFVAEKDINKMTEYFLEKKHFIPVYQQSCSSMLGLITFYGSNKNLQKNLCFDTNNPVNYFSKNKKGEESAFICDLLQEIHGVEILSKAGIKEIIITGKLINFGLKLRILLLKINNSQFQSI